MARDLGQRARHFDAGRARAHDHERSATRAALRGRPTLGGFEREKDLVTNSRRLFDGLEVRRPLAPLVVAVVRGFRAGRHDERVVFEDRAVGEGEASGLRVDIVRLAEENAGVLVAAEGRRIGALISPGEREPVAT